MPTKIIVSYDGTHNEDDAIALGRLLARAGAEVALAYVRHTIEPEPDREALAEHEAQELLERGAELFGEIEVARHVIADRSTPHGLARLASELGAAVVVFCSDSHTAGGRVAIGNSAGRLLDGGRVAVGIAPAGLAQRAQVTPRLIAAVRDGEDSSAQSTAAALAEALHASAGVLGEQEADLLVIGSRPQAEPGTVSLSARSEHLIEEGACPVLVLPAQRTLSFNASALTV
jgi:nucleotide-binding universal stress UspA family protein